MELIREEFNHIVGSWQGKAKKDLQRKKFENGCQTVASNRRKV